MANEPRPEVYPRAGAIESAYGSSGPEYGWRFRDGNANTDDFIALAAQVSGRADVVPFLRDWLYGTKTPPMPGHPDWTVNAPATQRALTAPARPRERK